MNKKIWFAGGCFWGIEAYFDSLKGVVASTVGYAQSKKETPSYEEVCTGQTESAEALEITYDDKQITLEKLLEHLFRIIDPTSINKQGNDVGTQYRTGVYFIDDNDKEIITNYLKSISIDYEKPIVVENEKLENFYFAEEYHQKYLKKNPTGYCHINLNTIKDEERK